jgi:exonuclease III
LEFNTFLVIGVYAPNGMSRPEYRHKEWDPDFLNFVSTIRENSRKEIIIIGDMNVPHQKDLDDLASHNNILNNSLLLSSVAEEENKRKNSSQQQSNELLDFRPHNVLISKDLQRGTAAAEHEEQRRQNFTKLVSSVGLVDTFRHLYPQDKKFTSFSSTKRRRGKKINNANNDEDARNNHHINHGGVDDTDHDDDNGSRRLDYALITNTMLPKLKDSQIMSSIQGSDHCPIELHLTGMISAVK